VKNSLQMESKASSLPPFALLGIEHVLLLVRGMDDAVAFYEGVLGATVEARMPHFGMAELRAGTSHIDLVDVAVAEGAWARPSVAGGRNVDHVALRLDGGDETSLRRHLAAHRVDVVEERVEAAGRLSLYVHDPSGNVIELMT
jgi:glyoxylase I family protein